MVTGGVAVSGSSAGRGEVRDLELSALVDNCVLLTGMNLVGGTGRPSPSTPAPFPTLAAPPSLTLTARKKRFDRYE